MYYQLCLLVKAFNVVYDYIIHPPGHGKCIVDSQNGVDKVLLDLFFNCLVENLEELAEGTTYVLTHTRGDGKGRVSLAKVCYDIINDIDRTRGAKSHSN